MRHRTLLLVAALVGGIGLAACGSSGGSDDGGAGTEAAEASGGGASDGSETCAVVSVDEVADATGTEVTEAQALPTGCMWVVGDSPEVSYEWQEVSGEGFEANRELGEREDYDVEDLSGLGDEAFLRTQLNLEGDPLLSEVWVRTGDTVFFVRSTLPAGDEVAAAVQAVAELIVDRLG